VEGSSKGETQEVLELLELLVQPAQPLAPWPSRHYCAEIGTCLLTYICQPPNIYKLLFDRNPPSWLLPLSGEHRYLAGVD